MKTWTNPELEELKVEKTAGGPPFSEWEDGWLPGPKDPNQTKDDETTDGNS